MIYQTVCSSSIQPGERGIGAGFVRNLSAMMIVVLSAVLLQNQSTAAQVSTGNAKFDSAVSRGVAFLKANAAKAEPGRKTLAAYALFKAGEPVDSPIVAEGIRIATGSVASGKFQPHVAYDHVYESGLYAMFLADVDAVKYQPILQNFADYVVSVQRADGSWSDTPLRAYDTSMCQYAMLTLWAAHRSGCRIPPEALDRSVASHVAARLPDGGWTYRPDIGDLNSTRNMTMAALSSLTIAHILFYGPPRQSAEKPKKKFGVLEEESIGAARTDAVAFAGYQPENSSEVIQRTIQSGISYETQNFSPVNRHGHFPIYFYYAAERALTIAGIKSVSGREWYSAYGEGLLTLQNESGSWKEVNRNDEIVGTSFAILFFMRSTQQILDKLYGPALQRGNRGNPFGDKPVATEAKSLDMLLSAIDNVDLNKSELNEAPDLADEIVRSVTSIRDPKELIGQKERLKALVNHPDAEVRRPVYWALGRTGDLSLVPTLLKGLRDSSVDVNVEAEQALRYIARRPSGFGYPVNPLDGAERADERTKAQKARQWRDRAVKLWLEWYFSVQSYEDQQSVNQIDLFRLKNPDAAQ